MDDLKEWTSLPMPKLFSTAFPRKDWKRISAEASIVCPPTTQSIKGLNGSELCRVDLRLERQHTLHFMITCSSCSVYLPLFLTGAELGFTKRSGQRVFCFFLRGGGVVNLVRKLRRRRWQNQSFMERPEPLVTFWSRP